MAREQNDHSAPRLLFCSIAATNSASGAIGFLIATLGAAMTARSTNIARTRLK